MYNIQKVGAPVIDSGSSDIIAVVKTSSSRGIFLVVKDLIVMPEKDYLHIQKPVAE